LAFIPTAGRPQIIMPGGTNMRPLTILVCGATGRLGQLVPTLLKRGHHVRAATRDTESAAARALADLGAQPVQADFDDRPSLAAAAHGADVVFAAGTGHAAGPQGDIRHGINVADAVRAAGDGHLVFVSVAAADRPTGVPVFDSKHAVEQHIRQAGVPYTIIAPVYYMDNVWNPWNRPALNDGRFPSPVPVARRVQQVSISDLIAFAAAVSETPDRFAGQRIALATDQPTAEECAMIVSGLVGRKVEPVGPFPDQHNPLFDWLDRAGDHLDVQTIRATYPDIDWHDFSAWAATQDWTPLTKG
jgi:uncharacterized protein YbjT (DUF2867 family)